MTQLNMPANLNVLITKNETAKNEKNIILIKIRHKIKNVK